MTNQPSDCVIKDALVEHGLIDGLRGTAAFLASRGHTNCIYVTRAADFIEAQAAEIAALKLEVERLTKVQSLLDYALRLFPATLAPRWRQRVRAALTIKDTPSQQEQSQQGEE